MKRIYTIIFICILISISGKILAQVPQIQKVEALSTYPTNRILISGSGFSNTSSQLQVWFGQVKGNITASSDYAIEVDVPAQARLDNVEVINLITKLSAKSSMKFMPSFNGEPFDQSKFTTPLSFTSVNELWDLCSCDLNNDSKPDIISTKFQSPATDLMILQNQSTLGSLAFTKLDKTNLAALDLTFPADNVVCGDLQGDGKPDLVVTRSGSPRNSIHILTNTSGGAISFAAPLNLFLTVGHLATRSTIKDLNGDGKPEIIVTNSFDNNLYIFQNQSAAGVLSFNATPIKVQVTNAANTYSIDVQDLDNDGLPDIIVNQFQTSDIFILKNNSAGAINFPSVQKISITGTFNRLTSADVNNDGLIDLIATSVLNKQLIILLNASTTTSFSFSSNITLSTSGEPWSADVSDIDGDGDPDIIVTNRTTPTVNVFLHNGDFTTPSFSKKDITTSKASRNIIAGDLDGDGKPDIAFTSFNATTSSYSLDILRNKNCHQPKILNTGPLVICAGQTIRLNAIPALNVAFSWMDGATPLIGSNSYLDITSPGVYTVTAQGESSACDLTSTSITVTANPGAPPSDPGISSDSPLCSGSDLHLSTPVVASAIYTWTGPNNYTSSLREPVIAAVDIQDAGLYSLQVSVGSCKSNTKTSRVDIVDLDDISLLTTVASNTICQGNNLMLSVANDVNYTYKWLKNNIDIAGQTTNSLNVTQGGNYTLQAKNINFANCTKTTNPTTVAVLAPPVSSFQLKATGCVNELITFTDQSTTDPASTPVYSWSFGDTGSAATASPTHKYLSSQGYSASLLISYNGVTGCSNSSNKGITISNSIPPVIVADSDAICPGEETNLSIAGTYTSISWSNGNGTTSTTINAIGDYTVDAVDVNGCPVSDGITITSKEVPVITVSSDKTILGTGDKAQLQADGADVYVWEPVETLTDATIANPIASPTTTTTYTVTGTLTTGCSASNQITLTIDESKINIKIPSGFSPNGDGSNDRLHIQGITEYPECTLNIFDGRGRRIYQAKGDDGWDGTYQSKPVPDGTYYYVFSCPTGKPVTGSILVFR